MKRLAMIAFVLAVAAVIAAVVPLSRPWVERWYSSGLFPRIQAVVTPVTNLSPVALLDVTSLVLVCVLLFAFVRRARTGGLRDAAVRGLLVLVALAAVAYLLFLALWGLNYRRVPLEQKLAFDRSRITTDAAVALAGRAITAMNEGYAQAHQTSFDPAVLASAFGQAERSLGVAHPTVPGVPKRSVLTWYFRRAAIDGMTVPGFLEVILNPGVLPFERPFVEAHEWAHLAGFADESEANFLAFVTCTKGDALARYSGWIAAYGHILAGLPRSERRALPRIEPGPRADLRAMAERYNRSSATVRRAARVVYDRYLRANRVPEGIASYDAVVRLLLGAGFDAHGTPQLR